MLDIAKLKSELSVIYEHNDVSQNTITTFGIHERQQSKTDFDETCKLLDIICPTPMSTVECKRCFSALKRVKTFLKSRMSKEGLKKIIQSILDFDTKVIDIFFPAWKSRRINFMYKK